MLKKVVKILITILIGVVIFSTNHNLFNLEKDNNIQEVIEPNHKKMESVESQNYEDINVVDPEKDNKLYEVVERGLINGEEKICLIGIKGNKSSDAIFRILEDVTKDNPEIMYYLGAKYSKGILWPEYEKDREEIKLHQKIIRERREKILSEIINPNMTDYDKVKAVHDYIINNTRYDRTYLQNQQVKPESHSVYGVLAEGVAVCDGYAKTVKYLLDPLNIEAIVVNGKSKGMNHAWNIIKIEEEYYHLDATWDDPVTEDGQDIIVYDYFNLNDEDISKTHSWENEKYPLCRSTRYNYYYYNNLLINNYEEFYSLLKSTLDEGRESISFRVLNYDKKRYNISETVENIVYKNIFSYKAINFNYSINEELGIININFKYEK